MNTNTGMRTNVVVEGLLTVGASFGAPVGTSIGTLETMLTVIIIF